jgi:hypothetical protein
MAALGTAVIAVGQPFTRVRAHKRSPRAEAPHGRYR